MSDCPFCKRIYNREYAPTSNLAVVRFEPLNPVTPGHMLFVPNVHEEYGRLTSDSEVGWCMREAARWGLARGEDFNLITSSGTNATQTVPHLHIHYVPRREGDGLHLPWTGQHE